MDTGMHKGILRRGRTGSGSLFSFVLRELSAFAAYVAIVIAAYAWIFFFASTALLMKSLDFLVPAFWGGVALFAINCCAGWLKYRRRFASSGRTREGA